MSLFDNKSNYIIRSTGEEVEVIASHKESEGERSKEDWVSYIDSQGREHYKEHLNLDFDFRMSDKLAEHFAKLFDFPKPEPIKLPELPPHDMELRERAAVSAMQGMLSNPALVDKYLNYGIVIEKAAIWYADALIAKLKETSNETNGWISIKDRPLEFGEEVIGYNPAWIDEDSNSKGIRIGFLSDYGDDEVEGQTVAENPSAGPRHFCQAKWCNYHDEYHTLYGEKDDGEPNMPTHYMIIPNYKAQKGEIWKVVDNVNHPQADRNKIYCVFTKGRYILAKVICDPQDEDLLQWKCTEFPFHRYDMCEGDKYMQIV